MTYSTLNITQIKPSDNNPRQNIDDAGIKSLAQSIKQDGLLQNLVVSKPKGKKKTYGLISGERRYRAISLLIENDELDAEFQVPVEIREKMSEEDSLRLATIENLQREDMHPMDEADAVAGLLTSGTDIEEVSAKTGFSIGVIRRRLALSGLCDEAKAAFRAGEMNLSQAEALTIGTAEQQKDIIEDGLDDVSATIIKRWLTSEKANVAMAIFDTEQYSGTYTSDLFASAETTYFDDVEQFLQLQEAAVEEMKTKYESDGYEPVEIVEGYRFCSWQYRNVEPEDEIKGGVAIRFYPNGRVETHVGIIDRAVDERTRELTSENAVIETKPKPFYNRPVIEYIAMHKSVAVQAELVKNRRVAKEAAVAQMIGGGDWIWKINLEAHRSLSYIHGLQAPCPALSIIEDEATALFVLLGRDVSEDDTLCSLQLTLQRGNPVLWYEAVKSLSDDNLDRLHVFLTTICFGQGNTDKLDTNENSLFNRVATDLDIDMRDYWFADQEFLKRRNKDQLADIVKNTQSVRLFGTHLDKYKKGEVVTSLSSHFEAVFNGEAKTEEEQAAKNWLPEAFHFPAVDVDQPEEEIEEVANDDIEEEDEYLEAA